MRRGAAVTDSTAVHMAVAFAAMGSWAVLANRSHGAGAAMAAGIVQGLVSALITLGLKRLVEGLATRLPGRLALFGPPLAAWALSAALLLAIHGLAGTPELLATVAVPNLVATAYAVVWTLAVRGVWR
ncbi:MAG: hypothetical protein N2422_02465 [Rhodobacteraceae bacterium]|nr:hypothetical protein [Paracoccaceae bacterium]